MCNCIIWVKAFFALGTTPINASKGLTYLFDYKPSKVKPPKVIFLSGKEVWLNIVRIFVGKNSKT